jgi:hypothetical protein
LSKSHWWEIGPLTSWTPPEVAKMAVELKLMGFHLQWTDYINGNQITKKMLDYFA